MDASAVRPDSDAMYRALLNASPDGVVAIDLHGVILLANHTLEAMFGRSRSELEGQSLETLIPERLRPVHRAELARFAATGEKHLDWRRVGAVGLRADGSEFPMEIAFTETELGGARGFVAYLHDTTALALAHSELALVTDVRESILASVHEGIMGSDANGFITFANPAACATLGFTAEELFGGYGHDLFHYNRPDGSPYPKEECLLGQCLRSGLSYDSLEEVFWRKDGTSVPVEVSTAPLMRGGSHIGSVLTFRDVTSRRRLEEELRQTQRLESVGRLAGGIAHDFNNLLTVILSHAQFLLDALPQEGEDHHDVEAIREAGDRAAALTRQLLAYSRRQLLVPTEVRLTEVVTGVSALLQPLIGEHITVVTNGLTSDDEVVVDRGQLEQVIMNIVLNARDAMPGGGTVTITVERADSELAARASLDAGQFIVLRVSDTGCGMDARTLAHACEPFFTTKATGLGTGLGLATVAGIVAQSAGRLLLESTVGQGTTVSVLLPHRRLAAVRATRSPVIRGVLEGGTGATILLAEDEAHVREAVRRMLNGAGYRVLEAEHGVDARRVAAEDGGPIDLLLTDVVMPHENGVLLADWYEKTYPQGRVIFMSGYTEDSQFLRDLSARAVDYVAKPFTAEAILDAVRRSLAQVAKI